MANRSIILDPGEIRVFAGQLRQFNHDLADGISRLNAQFLRLGETWRDPAYARFTAEFQQTVKNLHRFHQISEEVVPQLLKTADRADSVHG